MLDSVTAYIKQHALLPEHGEIIVAVSGGADSLCLLHLLHCLCGQGKRYADVRLHVAHLNHRLRGEASLEDATYVAQIAESWGLPATIGSIDVPALAHTEHRSLEDAARTARYRFLRDVAHGQPIAVAHQRDDQVETLLLHWLRGGGLASMVGLQARQQDILRPLLAVTHADTVAYCQQWQLQPLEDASNSDVRFLRHRIRHELLPLLEAMNPAIGQTILRNAETMHVDLAWIEAQVDAAWPSVVLTEKPQHMQISIGALLALPLSLQRHLLRRVTSRLNLGQSPLELRHYKLLEQLMHRIYIGEELTLHLPQQVSAIRRGDILLFQHQHERIHRAQGSSFLTHDEVVLPIPGRIEVPGTTWIAVAEIVSGEVLQKVQAVLRESGWETIWHLLPATSHAHEVYVDAASIGNSLRVRTRHAGDRMQPLGMAHEKKVQDILVDKHILRGERVHIPLFFSSSHCLWLAGVCLDESVRLTSATQHIVRLAIEK